MTMFGFLFSTVVFPVVFTLCPGSIKLPCVCTSTRYEAVSIVCDKAKSLEDVKWAMQPSPPFIDSLIISNTPIEEMPAFAFQDFSIKRLVLRNNGMMSIHENAFTGSLTQTLEEIEIRGNHLESIPQSGLPQLRNLKMLSLSDNLIQSIGDNSFLSYHSRNTIVKLDLSANNLSYLHSQSLLGLETLQQLSLDKNNFRKIPTEALLNIPTLVDLSMGVNHIETVEADQLPLPMLKSLSLEVNQIRSIPGEAFQTIPGLTYLYLGNNLFTAIEPTMFFYTRQLKVLSMGNNKDIQHIVLDSFQFVPQLIRLELTDCSLTNIASQSLHKLPKIQVISMGRNQLTSIGSATFAALPDLVSVDLSSNVINHIEEFAFSQLPSLDFLDLSSNRLESLPQNMLYDTLTRSTPTRNRVLYLHNNPWRCDDNLAWLRRLLRENGDIQTSPPGAQNTRCWSPAHLSGLDIRQTDPIIRKAETIHIGESMRKYVLTTPSTYGSPLDLNEMVHPPQISQVNIYTIVLGCALGILALCLILLFIIRCINASATEKKTNSSNFSTPSVNSGFSTSFSGQTMFPEQYRQRSATNANVFLNRPRYWWF